jgi:hypothetical protein
LVVQSKHTVTNAEVSSKNKFARRRKRTLHHYLQELF